MARFEMIGLDNYNRKLDNLGGRADEVVGHGIYKAADIVADAIRTGIESIPVDNTFGTTEKPAHGIRKAQKDGLLASFGIAKLQKDGEFWNVRCGFDGYNKAKSKRYPNGQPNAMIARSIEKGTSFMRSFRFFSKAVNSSKGSALDVMEETIDNEIKDIFGGK